MLTGQPSAVTAATRGLVRARQALIGVRVTQPFPADPLQRAVLFEFGLRDADPGEELLVAEATAIAMFSMEMPRWTTSTPAIGLTSSVSTGASFMNASQPPVVRSSSAVRMLP